MSADGKVTKEEAQSSLGVAEKMQWAGFKRGMYPRWYGALVAVWSGVLVAALTSGSGLWLLLLAAGLIGHFVWYRKRGAMVNEIGSKRDLVMVLLLAVVGTGVAASGFVGLAYGLQWAPYAAGIALAGYIYGIMEVSYHDVWRRMREESN